MAEGIELRSLNKAILQYIVSHFRLHEIRIVQQLKYDQLMAC